MDANELSRMAQHLTEKLAAWYDVDYQNYKLFNKLAAAIRLFSRRTGLPVEELIPLLTKYISVAVLVLDQKPPEDIDEDIDEGIQDESQEWSFPE